MKRSIRDRLIAALEAKGERIVPHASRRYVVMTATPGRTMGWCSRHRYWFIGRNGAIRLGDGLRRSYSMTHLRNSILQWGERGATEGDNRQ